MFWIIEHYPEFRRGWSLLGLVQGTFMEAQLTFSTGSSPATCKCRAGIDWSSFLSMISGMSVLCPVPVPSLQRWT